MSEGPHTPTATVVVTTHNRDQLAQRAVGSALAQTLTEIEVIVVDDGSEPPFVPTTDDPRLRVIRNERAGGVCRARNAGLADARGAWITFLDDDDVLVPAMLERSIATAQESSLPAPVAAMSAVVVLDVDGHEDVVLRPADELRRGEDFCLERRGTAGRASNSLVVPTASLRAIGGWDPELEAFQHDDLGLRLNAVASIVGIPEPLYRMTTHRAPRVSARTSVIPSDMARTMEKHPDAFARHPAAHARYLGITGYYHLKNGDWAEAVRWTARGVLRNPVDPRLWRFLAAALAGPHVVTAYRRVVPRESTVSVATLNRRRARKYLRRAGNYPRAMVGWATAPLVRATIRRHVPMASGSSGRVLFLCIYRAENVSTVSALLDEGRRRGWDVRLWALDAAAPALAAETIGVGPGAKFPLLNELVADADLDGCDWVVVADDDFRVEGGDVGTLLAVAEAAGLDLVQPAHTELSHRENEITVRRPFTVARRTTFVEIGPMFAVRGRWIPEVVPFPADHTMGWGLELEWFDLEHAGARLGIVDGVALRHLHPVGKGYAKREQNERLRARLRARGLDSFAEIQRTRGTWWAWHGAPRWASPPGESV